MTTQDQSHSGFSLRSVNVDPFIKFMNSNSAFFLGLLCGAGLMFMLDPVSGKRRLIYARDKGIRFKNKSLWYSRKVGRNLANHAQGMKYRYQHRNEDTAAVVDDDVLVQRVRSFMGRHVSHARAINVTCDAGVVTLSGPILADELPQLIKVVERVPGVSQVINELESHQTPERISGLQGQGPQYLQ